MRLASALTCVAALALGACASGSTKAGTSYSYRLTALKADLSYPIDKVFEASKKAVEDLGFTIENANADALEGIIVAKGATNHTRKIHMERMGPESTHVEIFVGPTGSAYRSEEILNRIEDRLAAR
jgi:hypothetical protein